ncbi:MAG: response regulator [Bacilli bacterium]
MTTQTRLLLADDQSLFLSGMEALLTMTGEFAVVATARTGAEVLAALHDLSADVLLLDIGMPDRSGIETVRQLRGMGVTTPVLIVSNYDGKDYVLQAISAGVQGYVLKDATIDTVRAAVRTVAAGQRYVDPRLVGYMMDALTMEAGGDQGEAAGRADAFAEANGAHGAGSSGISGEAAERADAVFAGNGGFAEQIARTQVLTRRELEVLQLMAQGCNNGEIAKTLFISPKTARNHTTSILQKLGVPDRTKAVVIALSERLGASGNGG